MIVVLGSLIQEHERRQDVKAKPNAVIDQPVSLKPRCLKHEQRKYSFLWFCLCLVPIAGVHSELCGINLQTSNHRPRRRPRRRRHRASWCRRRPDRSPRPPTSPKSSRKSLPLCPPVSPQKSRGVHHIQIF